MKRFLSIVLTILCAFALFSCTKKTVIYPLYTEVDMNNLPDGIYHVRFEKKDVTAKDGNLYINADIYSEDIYDTVDIHNMKVGDYFCSSGNEEKIEKLLWDEQKSSCCINFDSFDDAMETIEPSESGGTYYISGPDGHHSYTERGKANIRLDKICTLRDSSDLDKPEVVKKYADIEKYIKDQEFDNFFCLNTSIRIENGLAVEVTRWYIP